MVWFVLVDWLAGEGELKLIEVLVSELIFEIRINFSGPFSLILVLNYVFLLGAIISCSGYNKTTCS